MCIYKNAPADTVMQADSHRVVKKAAIHLSNCRLCPFYVDRCSTFTIVRRRSRASCSCALLWNFFCRRKWDKLVHRSCAKRLANIHDCNVLLTDVNYGSLKFITRCIFGHSCCSIVSFPALLHKKKKQSCQFLATKHACASSKCLHEELSYERLQRLRQPLYRQFDLSMKSSSRLKSEFIALDICSWHDAAYSGSAAFIAGKRISMGNCIVLDNNAAAGKFAFHAAVGESAWSGVHVWEMIANNGNDISATVHDVLVVVRATSIQSACVFSAADLANVIHVFGSLPATTVRRWQQLRLGFAIGRTLWGLG